MSRIGNKVIVLPAGVEITNNDNVVTVKGPKGKLTREFSKDIEIRVEGTEITLHRPNDSKEMKTIHGTTRALLNNMVVGVSEGFKKELEMRGVGYRAQLQGKKLVLSVGKSHPDEVEAPEGIILRIARRPVDGRLPGCHTRTGQVPSQQRTPRTRYSCSIHHRALAQPGRLYAHLPRHRTRTQAGRKKPSRTHRKT